MCQTNFEVLTQEHKVQRKNHITGLVALTPNVPLRDLLQR